ncbi:MAG TPA: Gfo/Idh/MocA family oxidoreductase [Pyrinomonadaceae bacterium]|nr:Gfo/Idh/MocA family oxidoreductase [Pyrinomonadaceae bacterium]
MRALNWGLIGAGDISKKRIAPALRDLANCNFVAVSRARAELAEEFAKEFGAKKWFADWKELLADDEVEAVYIATPVFVHKEQTIKAAEAGKHVLCEKPMALSTAECDEMLAACRANNVRLGIAYYRRFYPLVNRVKELIASGEIGKPTIAQINSFEFVEMTDDNPRHWFLEKAKSGGGPMMDFGCHRIEVLTNIFGEVRALKSIVSNAVFGREVEDTASALFQFENGTCANLTVTHAAREPQDTLDIFGTKGSIHIPVLNGAEMKIRLGNDERTESHAPAKNIHQPLIEDFTEAVLNGKAPTVTGEIGREIARLEEEIYRI